MKQFNVINFNFNAKKFESYDVIPYFVRTYNDRVEKFHEINFEASMSKTQKEFDEYKNALEYWKIPVSFHEFKKFIQDEARYQFWARCEYEIILVDWPCQKTEEKWDIYDQIMMNLDIITQIVMEETVLCVTE